MAWGTTDTLLSPFEWAQIMGISPWQIGQMDLPARGACNDTMYQFEWQKNHLSRDEISRAIAEAEFMFASNAGFWPAPKYFTNEDIRYPQDRLGRGTWFNHDTGGGRKGIRTKWGYVRSGGTFARTLISAGEAVVISASITAGDNDTFTVTVATSITDPLQIALYVPDTERMGQPLSELWRVRPINVTFNAGTATITGHISSIILPSLAWATEPEPLDALAASLLATVDVYRVYTDTTHTDDNQAQGYAIWEKIDCQEDEDCLLGTSVICVGDKKSDLGYIFVDFDPCLVDFYPLSFEPTRINLNYLAGYPLESNGRMNPVYADIVAKLATAYLPELSCGCERVDKIISYWQSYPPASGDNARFSANDEIQNPFGPAMGATYAWRRLQDIGFSSIVSVI